MSKLRPQRFQDSVQLTAMISQILVIRSIRQMPPPLPQFLILVNQRDYFLVQPLALAVGLIRARSCPASQKEDGRYRNNQLLHHKPRRVLRLHRISKINGIPGKPIL